MQKLFNKKNKFTLKDVDETQEDHSTPSFTEFLSNKARNNIDDDKICIGDKVQITTKKLTNLKGTVMYIGYPFPTRTVRYGINLEKARGEHDGTLMIDIKTEKVITKASHLKKYKKRIKKRTYFKAKSKHGILVKKDEISSFDRLATSATRFTVEDQVEVRFRGCGKIKFIGMLEHTKEMGVWYGIQLSDRRGRHDGTVNGVKYFACPPQYGLHTRLNHLTLLESEEKNGGLDANNANPKKRKSIGAKKQMSNKWAKVLGANEVKGFAMRVGSAFNLTEPNHNVMASDTMEINISVLSLKLAVSSTASTNMIVPTLGTIGTMASLSNILPPNMNFANGISVNVLPGMHGNKKKSNIESVHSTQASASEHASVKRGGTLAVLPGYSTRFKEKKFFDYFDFDEMEDELGEGEFGVVYKCRKVDIEEEDEYEYSTTLKSSTKYGSTTNTRSVLDYPGDKYNIDEDAYDENESDSMSQSYSSSDGDDEDKYFAVKKIKKAKFHHLNYQHKQETIKLLQQEIKLLEKIQHLKKRHMEGSQYIVDLMDVFEDRNYLYIVTNFCSGGNLWANIEDEQHSEKTIQSIMKQILEGLAFLHRYKIAHLDLKPDNIMFNAQNEIQLIDFGMSRMIPSLHKAGVLVGTPSFVAPEVIQGFYDKKADVWSVGIICFMLRFGYPPFFEGTNINYKSMDDNDEEKQKIEHEKLFSKIKKGFDPSTKPGLGPWFPSEIPIGAELKDLISKMLCSDLAKRLTAAECLTHPYFKTLADSNMLPLTIMDALTKFQGQCEFNVMIARLFAHQIERNELNELEECWNKFDKEGNGSLTLEQFKSVMREYDHGYKEYQIEAMFASLDWNETDVINFNSLVTAFSYQRLVAVDERLWEAFSRLDVDNDGHITKAEIKRVLAIVNPKAFDDGIKQLNLFKPVNENVNVSKLSAAERRKKNISLWIGDCMIAADWDDDGQIDYEEFLRALHPRFNESPVTPKEWKTPSSQSKITNTKFIFQPSLGTGVNYGNGNNENSTNKDAFDTYRNEHKVQND